MPKERRAPRLGRKQPSKDLETVHWIYCEGKTEAHCLDRLRQHCRISTAKIQLVERAGVPWTVVEKAKAKAKELKRSKLPFSVHAVFDEDEHPKFREAVQRARDLGLSIGISVPCFELWAILLHQDQTAHIDRHRAQSILKSIHPRYCHNSHPYLDPATVLEGLADARQRAMNLADRAIDAGNEFANPTTTFSQVIDAVFPDDLT